MYFTWYKTLEQKRGNLQFSVQTTKCKARWYLISQLVFFFLCCFPHHGSRDLLSEIDKNWNPLLQQEMPDPIPGFCCLDAHHTHPSFLWMALNTMHWWLAMFQHGNHYCLVGENTFQWFLFLLVMALNFSCFDMTAKMCTAFLCHPQTYFQHACFHEESEGSIRLARQWVWGVYMETICST